MARAALTSCENKVTFNERSYAHCSMYRYVHPRSFDSIFGMSYAHYSLADQALSRLHCSMAYPHPLVQAWPWMLQR